MKKYFSCAKCGKGLPLSKLVLLSENSRIKCVSCGTINVPKKSFGIKAQGAVGIAAFLGAFIGISDGSIKEKIFLLFFDFMLVILYIFWKTQFEIESFSQTKIYSRKEYESEREKNFH